MENKEIKWGRQSENNILRLGIKTEKPVKLEVIKPSV